MTNYKLLKPKSDEFLLPSCIIYGVNSLENLEKKLVELGNRALLVTDHVMSDIGYADKVINLLKKQNIKHVLYKEVNSEPKDKHVSEGLTLYQENNCDFLIALGGGSPIDATKAIAAMATNDGHISEYQGLGTIKNPTPPVVAIPTTAGTGSEVTQFTIITNTENNVKMLIGGKFLIPEIAVVDPLLTLSMPANITAATGIDALTHAIEAYTSRKHQPLSDVFALSSIRKISKYLRRAWANGDDLEARNEMMIASMEAGISFNNSSVTLVHGMSRPIGALFNIPHGISNAVLLPACMDFAIMGAPERFAKIAKAVGVDNSNISTFEKAKKGVSAVQKLCNDVEIPSISGLGIETDSFISNSNKMAKDALDSGSPNNTARKPTKDQIIEIYKKAL